MGLSIEELELQSSECLPAREVMTMVGGGGNHSGHCNYTGEQANQASPGLIPVNAVVENVQVGLVNVDVDDVCIADVLSDNDILNNTLSGNGASGSYFGY